MGSLIFRRGTSLVQLEKIGCRGVTKLRKWLAATIDSCRESCICRAMGPFNRSVISKTYQKILRDEDSIQIAFPSATLANYKAA